MNQTEHRPHFDADGNFIHPRCMCGDHAIFGYSVSLLNCLLPYRDPRRSLPAPRPGTGRRGYHQARKENRISQLTSQLVYDDLMRPREMPSAIN